MPRPPVSAEIIAKANMFSYKRQIQKLPAIRLPARGVRERAANRSLVFTSLALKFSGSLMAAGCWRQNGFIARTGLHILYVVAVLALILLRYYFAFSVCG